MSKSPAFQFYVNDFLGSAKVGMMSTEEVGAYTLLLCLDWQEGGFVYDPKGLAKWCRLSGSAFARVWKRVGECFIECDGRLYNPRLAREREKQQAWREKAAKGAAKTNGKRWEKGRSSDEVATAVATDKRGENGRTPSPTPTPTPITATDHSSPDDVARLLAGLPDDSARAAWGAEINVAKQGMHGPVLSQEQIDRACREYVGNGHLAKVSLRHFRGFLANVDTKVRPATVVPFSRPSKQEIGRQNLADAMARREREGVSNG